MDTSKQEGGSHYIGYKIQPIEFIHKNGLGFIQGNIIKYVVRYKEKGGLEDLMKARHYLDMLINEESCIKKEGEIMTIDWQPIETIPKTGEEVLVCYTLQNNVMELVRWSTIHGYWLNKGKPELHMHANLWARITKSEKEKKE